MPLTTSRTRLWVTHLSASAGPKPALPIQVNVLSLSQAGGPSTYRREEPLALAAPRQEAWEWLENASYGAGPRSGSRTTYSGRFTPPPGGRRRVRLRAMSPTRRAFRNLPCVHIRIREHQVASRR